MISTLTCALRWCSCPERGAVKYIDLTGIDANSGTLFGGGRQAMTPSKVLPLANFVCRELSALAIGFRRLESEEVKETMSD